jgi:hypothetical protein
VYEPISDTAEIWEDCDVLAGTAATHLDQPIIRGLDEFRRVGAGSLGDDVSQEEGRITFKVGILVYDLFAGKIADSVHALRSAEVPQVNSACRRDA